MPSRTSLNATCALPWAILIMGAISVIFLGGKRRAFGAFISELHIVYNHTSLTELNWIGDSYAALGYMSTSISVAIILHFKRRYALFQFIGAFFVLVSCVSSAYVPSPHWMFLTHTLLHGIGSSLIVSTVGLVVNEHFDKKHPYHILATTLVSGGSVAAIVFIQLFAYLIQTFDWRNAFLILGGLYFIVLASASLVFRRNDKVREVDETKKITCTFVGIKKFQVPLLVLWFIDRVITSVVTYGILLNLTVYSHQRHKRLGTSTTLTLLFAGGEGATYLVGAIITALTKNFFKNKLRYILFFTAIMMSASLVTLEFVKHIKAARWILCFIAGFSLGPSITFLFPAGEELTQLPGHLAYPFSLGGMGFGMLVSPFFSAQIVEVFHYNYFFLFQGSLIFIKAVCLLVIIVLLGCYGRYNMLTDYTEGPPRYDRLDVSHSDENIESLNSNSKSA